MLEEWIRNLPVTTVERIAADGKVVETRIRKLATDELRRRRELRGQAD
ncbi:hypothetical protein [Paramagnetospirillum kuznetsovii]|nr:hypothetical protein [Paramagnetospirillum kuznetsovii]